MDEINDFLQLDTFLAVGDYFVMLGDLSTRIGSREIGDQ